MYRSIGRVTLYMHTVVLTGTHFKLVSTHSAHHPSRKSSHDFQTFCSLHKEQMFITWYNNRMNTPAATRKALFTTNSNTLENRGNFRDLTGKTYGSLQVKGRHGTDANRHVIWHCVCTCGRELLVATHNLTKGNSTACPSHRESQLSLF